MGVGITQGHESERDLLVLHSLRCIGFTEVRRLAAAAGLTSRETLDSLEELAKVDLVSYERGVFGGWGMTELGRARDAELVSAELDAAGAREHVSRDYEDFMILNPRLLTACHDWQMRRVVGAHVLNDHSDPDYDLEVIERLVQIDRSVQTILFSVSSQLLRFDTYRRRLGEALALVDGGEHSHFTDTVDSYHAVWFQLHEDLLTTLGLRRGTDRPNG